MQRRWRSLALCAVLAMAAGSIDQLRAASVKTPATPPERILFVSNGAGKEGLDIFAIKPDGSALVRLTETDMLELDPVGSPDGRQIAFAACANLDDEKADLYVMNADGSQRRRLTRSHAFVFSPAWSPDGKTIAFSAMHRGLKARLYVIDADGKNLRQLGEGAFPAWSPDGKRLLYTVFTVVESENGEDWLPMLYTVQADGSGARLLTRTQAMMGAWSPDGRRIVCVAPGGGQASISCQADIYVMNADGSQPRQLTHTKEGEIGPRWSADGKRIFFTRSVEGDDSDSALAKMAIYAMDADGKNVRPLTSTDSMAALSGYGFIVPIGQVLAAALSAALNSR